MGDGNKRTQNKRKKIKTPTQKNHPIKVIVSTLCPILFYASLKNFQHRKVKHRTWVFVPGVNKAQEANSKTGQVLSNKNKRSLVLVKVGVKRSYGLKKDWTWLQTYSVGITTLIG